MKKVEQSEITKSRSKKLKSIPQYFCDDDINFGRAAKTGFWDTDLLYDDDYRMKD